MDVKKSVLTFAFIAFTLLGILFGMNIMTFIFGNLSLASSTSFDDLTVSVSNETDGRLNSSDSYTVAGASVAGFTGGVVVSIVYEINSTDGGVLKTIETANYTVVVATGVITNATASVFDNVTITYVYTARGNAELVTEQVANNSLVAIRTYSSQANTQFTTIAVAITLVVLLAVFAFFWLFFMGSQGSGGSVGAGRSRGSPRTGSFS